MYKTKIGILQCLTVNNNAINGIYNQEWGNATKV